jgi:hypothetical protein
VAGSRARPGAKNHLMAAQVLHYFLHQRIHRTAPAVHDALAADLDYVDPGQDGKVVGAFSRLLD